MGASGDTAEQVVRMSLEGSEYALRIAGKVAQELTVLLYAAAQEINGLKTGQGWSACSKAERS